MRYFESTNPEYPRFGVASTSDNHAEWIVDLTTKVRILSYPSLAYLTTSSIIWQHTHGKGLAIYCQ